MRAGGGGEAFWLLEVPLDNLCLDHLRTEMIEGHLCRFSHSQRLRTTGFTFLPTEDDSQALVVENVLFRNPESETRLFFRLHADSDRPVHTEGKSTDKEKRPGGAAGSEAWEVSGQIVE
jgi:hypothetical protein